TTLFRSYSRPLSPNRLREWENRGSVIEALFAELFLDDLQRALAGVLPAVPAPVDEQLHDRLEHEGKGGPGTAKKFCGEGVGDGWDDQRQVGVSNERSPGEGGHSTHGRPGSGQDEACRPGLQPGGGDVLGEGIGKELRRSPS